jgi:molybdopterin molybdotransferase
VADLLPIEEALRRILERVRPLASEEVDVTAGAGRVLAAPARSAVDLPPFDSSAMDGYALRAADTPGDLPVAERISAGRPASRALEAGEAMAIATGGEVPEGADAVVPIEVVTEEDGVLHVPERAAAGAHVRPRAARAAAPSARWTRGCGRARTARPAAAAPSR